MAAAYVTSSLIFPDNKRSILEYGLSCSSTDYQMGVYCYYREKVEIFI